MPDTVCYNVVHDWSYMVEFLIIVGCILVAMTVHEFMHAYVGHALGDTTAKEEGRLSLNPIRHIDPFMTLLLPAVAYITLGFIILAAKPVPFNPDRVKWGEAGAALLAFAGPLSNLVMAFLAAFIFGAMGISGGLTELIFVTFIQLNVLLFVFNLIPIPPLDGSRVLYAFAPEPVQDFMRRIEPFGFVIIIVLVLSGLLTGVISTSNQFILNLLP